MTITLPAIIPVQSDTGRADDATSEAWRQGALCAQTNPEAFFPEKSGDTEPAKKICASCDVREQCLAYALRNNERFGVWGGLSTQERDRVRSGQPVPAPGRSRARTAARNAAIIRMSEQDQMRASTIAEALGVTDRTVHRVLAKHREQRASADEPDARAAA